MQRQCSKFTGQFGSVVSSYFTFLRWVIFLNLIITLIVTTMVVIPEVSAYQFKSKK